MIQDLGYDIWIHTSPEFNPENFLSEGRNLLCNFFDINMTCLQKGSKIKTKGLQQLDAECEVLDRLHRELGNLFQLEIKIDEGYGLELRPAAFLS